MIERFSTLTALPAAGTGSSAVSVAWCSEADSELTLPGDEEEGAGDERDGGPGESPHIQTGSGWRPWFTTSLSEPSIGYIGLVATIGFKLSGTS